MGQFRTARCGAALAVAMVTGVGAVPVAAASPPETATCLAQYVSLVAPGGAFGPVVSQEARNPELLGVPRLGTFVRGFAQAPVPCPVVP